MSLGFGIGCFGCRPGRRQKTGTASAAGAGAVGSVRDNDRDSVRTANADVHTSERPNPIIGACRVWHSPPGSPSVNDSVAVNALPGNARRSPQRQNLGQRRRPPRSFSGGAGSFRYSSRSPSGKCTELEGRRHSRRSGMKSRDRDRGSVSSQGQVQNQRQDQQPVTPKSRFSPSVPRS